jgi:G:T-mismatch repair DNA endonuclease (very short patch repair protein)
MKEINYEYDPAKRFKQKNNFAKINRVPRRRAEPNALEWRLQKALGPSFTYTGNGSFTIDNLKPDFVDKTRKIVIEAYGDYWHRNEPTSKTMSKVARYQRQGYRAIIIWESEINDPIKLRRKLALI